MFFQESDIRLFNNDLYLIIIPSFILLDQPNVEINKFRESFYKFHRFNWIFIFDDLSNKTQIFQINLIKPNSIKNKTTTIGYNYVFKDWTKNLHGYHMNITYFADRTKSHWNYTSNKIRGIEGAFLYTLCKQINASCFMVNNPATYLKSNLVYDFFKNHSATINFNIQPTMNEYLTERGIVYLYPRRYDSLCVWVPKLKFNPNLILDPFTRNFAFFLLGFTIFSGILWYRLMLKTPTPRQLLAIYFTLIQFGMLQSSKIKFKNRFERILLVAFGFMSLIVVTCYQKLLSVLLIVPAFEPVLNTISELNASNLVIISETQSFMDFLEQAYKNDSFLERITVSDSDINDWKQFTYPNTATFDFKSNTERNLELFENFSNISLHIMDECLYSAPESYPVQGYFGFRKRFNFMITAITESGIEQRWNSYYEQLVKSEFLLVFKDFRKGLYTSNEINLNHLSGVLIFCAICWSVAVIVFAVEVVYGSMTKISCHNCKIFRKFQK